MIGLHESSRLVMSLLLRRLRILILKNRKCKTPTLTSFRRLFPFDHIRNHTIPRAQSISVMRQVTAEPTVFTKVLPAYLQKVRPFEPLKEILGMSYRIEFTQVVRRDYHTTPSHPFVGPMNVSIIARPTNVNKIVLELQSRIRSSGIPDDLRVLEGLKRHITPVQVRTHIVQPITRQVQMKVVPVGARKQALVYLTWTADGNGMKHDLDLQCIMGEPDSMTAYKVGNHVTKRILCE